MTRKIYPLRRRSPTGEQLEKIGVTLRPRDVERVRAFCETAKLPLSVFFEKAARLYLRREKRRQKESEPPENKRLRNAPEILDDGELSGVRVDGDGAVFTVF